MLEFSEKNNSIVPGLAAKWFDFSGFSTDLVSFRCCWAMKRTQMRRWGLEYPSLHGWLTLLGTNISHPNALLSRWFSFSQGGICDRSLEGKIDGKCIPKYSSPVEHMGKKMGEKSFTLGGEKVHVVGRNGVFFRKWTLWRCISYWTWGYYGYSIAAMLVCQMVAKNLYVSKKKGLLPPKSSILIGFFHDFHHPFWGSKSPYFWKKTYRRL